MRTDRIKVLLVVSIALTILSGILTYFAVIESRKRVDWVLHSYEVLNQSSTLLTSMSRVESTVRAFMLTKDSSFLKNYVTEKEFYAEKLAALRTLTLDNSHQTKLIDEKISPYIKYKLEQLGFVASLSREYGIDSAVNYSYANRTNLTILNLENYITSFTKHENSLLNERLLHLNTTLSRQNTIRYISFTLIGITLLFSYFTIAEKQKSNDTLIAKLNHQNAQLEQRVMERTQELDKQNTSITELNTQLQESMEEIQSFYETLHLKNQKAEDALEEISDLYNNAPCGYHSLNATGTFVRINDTELTWLGYTREEVIDKLSFSDVLTEESRILFKRIYPEFVKKGSVSNVEFVLRRKNGSVFPIILSSTAVYSASGEFQKGRTTLFDISTRKDLENKLIHANDSLIKLNEEKDHFLGIAAHDLKSPLNSVLGLLNLLRQEAGLTTAQQEYLGFIEQSCISMKRLIDNLLDINKIEQGGAAFSKEKILISDVLKDQEKTFKETAAKKAIVLNVNDLSRGMYIYTDNDALNRILENLISNAIKFSPMQREVIVQAIYSATHVRFEIIDQGPGISEQELPKLFGRFQKLSAKPTAGESSSGLGLSIVKELVELMKGKISVETKTGQGTKFITELPVNS